MKTRILSIICGFLTIPIATKAQNTISGTVTDKENNPLYGIRIVLNDSYLGTYSDANGQYKIQDVANGSYGLTATGQGMEPVHKDVKIENNDPIIDFVMAPSPQLLDEMTVEVTRAGAKTPTTYTDLDQKAIERNNYGQDLPFLLRFTPSAVVTSDAGAGIGYTGIRIRGVDPTRTNVTVNGIPLNDAESHGVFWVNMPDFASSVDNIQVQRGVGTSANGAAAFGASINIKTNDIKKDAYATIDNAYGSFDSWRHTLSAGTGLIHNKFSVDTRVSKITSNGYIDRASSDLSSMYLAGAWVGKKSSIKANIFTGKEQTYQAWYGTPESVVKGDQNAIIAYADRNYIFGKDRENLLSSGRTYNYYTYENEVDNYQQDHYQLHFAHRLHSLLNLTVSGHYTRGRGYYEQFREEDELADYGLEPVVFSTDTVTTGDLIRRRWLDNHFYGGLFSLAYKKKGLSVTLGGGANEYTGVHFGEILWAEFASNSSIRDRYYENDATKSEVQSYVKATYSIKKWSLFGEVQYRHINYRFLGVDDVSGEILEVDQTAQYNFINPKVGFMVDFNNKNNVYASFAVANREPVRDDFRENITQNRPEHENLMNTELGYRYKGQKLFTNINLYHMYYNDQLVLTGQINDVGGYTRTNVDKSYRLGVEVEAGYSILRNLSLTGNITLSQNKIVAFREFVDNYDLGGQDTILHKNTDLSFSPNIIAAAGIAYEPIKGLAFSLVSKYVGQQFLDNTSSADRMLDAYFFSNFEIRYTLKDVFFKEMTLGVIVNNVFDEKYENNGYTWGYVYGGTRTIENFYYPQAGRNFMTRLTIKI